MAYIVPRVLITQEFLETPIFADNPLSALIVGPQYNLNRYSVAAEKVLIKSTGYHNDCAAGGTDNVPLTVDFPNQVAGTKVDKAYTKVFFEKAEAEYFPNEVNSDNCIVRTLKTGCTYYLNRFTANTLVFKTGNETNRSGDFYDRDVQVGDVLVLHKHCDLQDNFRTKVKSVKPVRVPSSYLTATAGGANASGTVPTIAGTFTGANDIIYTITATVTGADGVGKFSVSSDSTDSNAAVLITSGGGVAQPLGNKGLTVTFAVSASITAGDVWTVGATAEADGAFKVIETTDVLPTTLVSGETWHLRSVRKVIDLEVGQLKDANTTNWSIANQTITLSAAIVVTDSTLNDNELPIRNADVFIQHRDLTTANAASIGSLSDPSLVAAKLGTVHPDNTLAQGVYDALSNAAGVSVYFCGLRTNDLAGYNVVLELARKSTLYYSLVPLTFDSSVKAAFVSHVNNLSTPENARWRITWLAAETPSTAALYVDNDGDDYVGTITDGLVATEYTLVTAVGTTFTTDLRPGDLYLTNYSTNVLGAAEFESYEIATVIDDLHLELVSGPASAVTSRKFEVKRNYTTDEAIDILAALGDVAGPRADTASGSPDLDGSSSVTNFNNRRVRVVFPGTSKLAGVTKPGYFLAAASAGLRSGVVPHQGLTNSPLIGFDDLTEAVITFTYDQLNRLASSGYWIVTQDVVGGPVYIRHQLTSDSSGLSQVEDSLTTNIDSISYGLHRAMAPYIGVWNINPDAIKSVRTAIWNELNYRQNNTYTARAGNQLISFSIDKLAQNATFKDRLDTTITLQPPYPMNFVTITLVV
jgi:hypothetical protein